MLFSLVSLLFSASLLPLSSAICGSNPSPEEIAAAESHFSANRVAAPERTQVNAVISVYYHIISPTEQDAGYIEGKIIQNEMKRALRRGGPSDLNVYTVGIEEVGLLEYSSLPYDYEELPTNDGIVISPSAFLGGYSEYYSEGKILVHEMGHWVGLYHPFDGGLCSRDGDLVDDTPRQSTYSVGCPEGKDSCPTYAGVDSIHNYMDYSVDSCRDSFTPGQIARMRDQMATYRFVDFDDLL